MPRELFYPELCDRYRLMIYKRRREEEGFSELLPEEFSPTHLLFMLDQIDLLSVDEQSLTKKHRWLGFVQAAMIAHGMTTVTAERDFTRTLFNGA